MTTNTYSSLVNIDDASSLDKAHWLTEARGLSLGLLDAEANLEDSETDARSILENALERRLKPIEEKGVKAREAVTKRLKLEKNFASWSELPDWYVDTYHEDNYEVKLSEYKYIRQIYKQTKENFEVWMEGILPSFTAEIYEQRYQRLLATEKAARDHEYEDCNPTEVLGKYNNLHWEGVHENGRKLLFQIRKLKALGVMGPGRIKMTISHVRKLAERKELSHLGFCECMSILLRWQGHMPQSRSLKAEAIELDNARKESKSQFQSMPVEPSSYSMDIESAIDLKDQALQMASMNLSLPEAMTMLVDKEEY